VNAGVVAVSIAVAAYLFVRWRRAPGWRNYNVRIEWRYWALGAMAIGVAVSLSVLGRLATLLLTPFVLVPAGAYLILHSRRGLTERDRRMRLYGWLTVLVGTLGAVAALSTLIITGHSH
jgi:uncharacterized membrane protein YfcA